MMIDPPLDDEEPVDPEQPPVEPEPEPEPETEPVPVDAAAVNRLLTESRAAHARYREAANPPTGADRMPVRPPNYVASEQQVAEALTKRLEAHEMDPEHTASGWRDDRASDAELIRFYVAYSKPLIPEEQMAQILERFPEYEDVAYIP